MRIPESVKVSFSIFIPSFQESLSNPQPFSKSLSNLWHCYYVNFVQQSVASHILKRYPKVLKRRFFKEFVRCDRVVYESICIIIPEGND